VNARSTSPLLAALALVAFAASARAEAPVAAPADPAPVIASALPHVPPLPAVPPPALAAPDPELPESPAPLVGAQTKPARVPLAKRWWFWAGLGTAAVGVVLAAIFVRPRDPYTGNAMPGNVTLF
jgi:hypothetical protein